MTTRRRRPAARTRPAPVDWDVVADVRPADPQPGGAAPLAAEERYDGLRFDGVAFGDVAADHAELLDCVLESCTVDDGRLRHARLATCVVDELRANALDVADSSWDGVLLRGGRFGALVAHGAYLERVTIERARLDYVNLREATLEKVQFLDCRIGELDLGGARLTGVRFAGCGADRLVIRNGRLEDADLRGLDFAEIEGVAGLAGARIDEGQLALLAPFLAAHLGIKVGAPPED